MGYIILGIMFVVFIIIVIVLNVKKENPLENTLYTKEDFETYNELKTIVYPNDNSMDIKDKEDQGSKEYIYLTSLSDEDSDSPKS